MIYAIAQRPEIRLGKSEERCFAFHGEAKIDSPELAGEKMVRKLGTRWAERLSRE